MAQRTTLFFAVFNSAHRVMKAEQRLKQHGLAILLIPAPRAFSTDCGLAIRYDSEMYDQVLQLLEVEELMPVSIFRKDDDGDYRVIWQEAPEQTKLPES